ncbi:hypothetical protein JD844_027231 [Phrynosoma platyrhinos]|uniref:TBC1 domain family member 1 n=1 Tax=Phrynosoma platyrhinos TaxID=52577 RepID=A0ABQ7SFX5_PHRPL|nr:hypothetical protein JD844_027231 [Phrynosoma platyrhinos]
MKVVPEIISTIRQAGKIARQEEFQNNLSDVEDPFSKKFEVLFCGRVTVAHKNAPPALIDECIEKFNDVSYTKNLDSDSFSQQHETANHSGGFSISDKFRSVFQPLVNEEQETRPMRKSYSQPGLRSFAFKKDLQAGNPRSHSFVRSFDDDVVSLNLKSQFIHGQNVQPTDIAGNRIMLFTIGQSEVYIISPDTKKVVIEKSFKEISFCSQGIRHVDHFGFICREASENGGFHFVCYVFQCTDEALVDEIMMTLKQAFTVAAVQQNPKAQFQLCDRCPMQSLHKLCEKIEGMHPSKTKLEIQKHLTTLNNQEQASVFEEVQKIRPRNEQKENELIISVLRNMYEEKQKDHIHLGEAKQITQSSVEAMGNEMPSSTPRFRLDMLKSKAKRSLTESLENILSRETSVCEGEDLLPTESPLKANGSVNNVLIESESPCTEQPTKSAYQGFRRRANTLTHIPTESQDCSQPSEVSPSVPQRKLMRYHSVGTETPHQQNSNSSPDQSMPAPPPSPPPAHLKSSASSPNFLKHLKPNSSGEQNKRTVPKSTSYRSTLRKKLHSSSSVPNFLKFLAPVDENNTSDFRNIRRTEDRELEEVEYIVQNYEDGKGKPEVARQVEKLDQVESEELTPLAVTITSENNLLNKRLKLDYEEITPCLKEVTLTWEKMLGMPGRSKMKFDMEKIHAAVGKGVPRHHRGEIWKFLAEQYQLNHQFTNKQQPKDTPYKELLKQLTSQQHAILIDLGRTFPTHPYFSAQLGAGQLSLYNILKAYSLLDQEVGYCQGLSFVAGVLLLHMSEEEAFRMLKFLMFDMGLRKQYRPDMTILQVFEMDISKQLQAYEVEYHVLQDELIDSSLSDNQRMDKLENANSSLRKQNFRLLEELQIQNLEGMVETLLNNESKLKQTVLTLELERKTLLETVKELRTGSPVPSRKPLFTRQEHMDAAN